MALGENYIHNQIRFNFAKFLAEIFFITLPVKLIICVVLDC